jgi:hypothetical protein
MLRGKFGPEARLVPAFPALHKKSDDNPAPNVFSFASEVYSGDDHLISCYFVCFVEFVDRSIAAKKTIHEFHEPLKRLVTRKLQNVTGLKPRC